MKCIIIAVSGSCFTVIDESGWRNARPFSLLSSGNFMSIENHIFTGKHEGVYSQIVLPGLVQVLDLLEKCWSLTCLFKST